MTLRPRNPEIALKVLSTDLGFVAFIVRILLGLMSLQVLAYGQSEYVRQFGMNVDSSGPLKVQARILRPPTLKYGPGSKQPTIVSTIFPLPKTYVTE